MCSFFAWLDQHGIRELPAIEPFHVAAYIKSLKVSDPGNLAVKDRAAARPTVKQHLAAIRMLFDWLIVGQVLAINPANAVRGPKHVINRGKTPVLTEEQARRLLEHFLDEYLTAAGIGDWDNPPSSARLPAKPES